MEKRYRIIIVSIITVICSIVGFFFLLSQEKISDIYRNQTQESIIDLKKTFLQDTVNNIISEIEQEKQAKIKHYKNLIDKRIAILDSHNTLSETEFSDLFIHEVQSNMNLDYWEVILWNSKSKRVLFDPKKLIKQDIETELPDLKLKMSCYGLLDYGNLSAIIGVNENYINERVKTDISNKIRNLKFQNGAYIWVNEIINYEGGTNYAIRRVHPNFPETEGMYLSTKMTDKKGKYPYLIELEGVKKDGELFFTYYFKKLDCDVISEKLTYAKLYRDYNWVIAMGVHTDDMQVYADKTNEKSKALVSKMTMILGIVVITIVILCLFFLFVFERMYLRHSKKLLESEMSKDPLTKAFSRSRGANDLVKAYKEYKVRSSGPAIVIFDVDRFKCINDTYGHDVGDQVLREIVETTYKIIRMSDKIIRWGGDEFVCLLYGLKEENALFFCEKILSAVSSLQIPVGNETISPTLSMGISYFQEDDQDYLDVLKRADRAMYQSKSEGRNLVRMINGD